MSLCHAYRKTSADLYDHLTLVDVIHLEHGYVVPWGPYMGRINDITEDCRQSRIILMYRIRQSSELDCVLVLQFILTLLETRLWVLVVIVIEKILPLWAEDRRDQQRGSLQNVKLMGALHVWTISRSTVVSNEYGTVEP